MKVSTKVELGIVALADIAIYSEEGCTVSSAEISQRRGISQKYLEQILVSLRQGGFIRGQKGSKGGYILTRPPEKMAFSDILNALDNSILADTYIYEDDSHEDGGMRFSLNCCVWDKLNLYMRQITSELTLRDLISQYRSGQPVSAPDMYYI
ncbi:MAG: Rrf2 family transcriptional regulator [Ruminococcus sp.]|nr:Rrf2 family transcriptional regulator [Ruminococcus sp.]